MSAFCKYKCIIQHVQCTYINPKMRNGIYLDNTIELKRKEQNIDNFETKFRKVSIGTRFLIRYLEFRYQWMHRNQTKLAKYKCYWKYLEGWGNIWNYCE